jgi:ribosome maturation factor RimP
MPFKVLQQYRKNIGNQVSVLMKDGTKYTGKLVDADHAGIRAEIQEKVRVEGRKKPEVVTVTKELLYNEIKFTKAIINF